MLKKGIRFRVLILLLAFVFTLPAGLAAQGHSTASGVLLFQQGQYSAAYASLWPALTAGDPEAAFFSLVIRRNGLDGRAPADAAEMASLWRILAAKADVMAQALYDRAVPAETKHVYRTALAQLEYFGPNQAPAWPPAPAETRRTASYQKAISLLGNAAVGFTPAMNFKAFLDSGTRDNHKNAFHYTERAAGKGDFLAAGNLAWLYRDGLGTHKNDLRAAHWARAGCSSTPPIARNMNEVGYFYESGRGVSPDPIEAQEWYKKAAEQGHSAGAANLNRLKSKNPAGPTVLDNLILF
ncbi:hypothetical protein LJB86_00030 [Deltaproteobacteria bacterium OttesenSCG-928-M10]|nr:hypothetical protein [Deltaproteobacteria bacterium OttesenSCG-928-M10]